MALILTFSRGALVGLAAGLGFVALARYRRLIPYLLAGGVLFLILPVTQGYLERFVEIADKAETTAKHGADQVKIWRRRCVLASTATPCLSSPATHSSALDSPDLRTSIYILAWPTSI